MSVEQCMHHCEKMAKGNIPYQSKFYVISKRKDEEQSHTSQPVTIVNPTQQQVEQAKERMKRGIKRNDTEDFDHIESRNPIPKKYRKK